MNVDHTLSWQNSYHIVFQLLNWFKKNQYYTNHYCTTFVILNHFTKHIKRYDKGQHDIQGNNPFLSHTYTQAKAEHVLTSTSK